MNDLMSLTLHPDLPLITFVRNWIYAVKRTEVKEATFERLVNTSGTMSKFRISQLKVGNITILDVQQYVQDLVDAGYRLSTIKKLMRIVSAPIHYAHVNGYLRSDPCQAVKPPSQSRVAKQPREVVAYTPEEQEALLKIIHNEFNVTYLLAEFMLETGLRIGEAMALKWADVSPERRRMRIHATMVYLRNGKGTFVQEGAKSKSSNRTIPLSKRAVEILNTLKEVTVSEFVFAYDNGEVPTYEAIRWHINKLCIRAGVTYHGLHVWRHTFATNQYYKGTDVKILSKLLGHSETSITYNVYIHLYGDGFDEMLKAVD